VTRRVLALLVTFTLFSPMDRTESAIAGEDHIRPPVAARIEKDVTVHEDERSDPYFWLRERDNPEVRAYLEAENAYAKAKLVHTQALQETLYREIVGRIQETDSSVPEKFDDYYYYRRTEKGKQYSIHCRRHGSEDAPEEILVDENALAEGHAYFHLGAFAPSPDHKRIAYSVDTAGSEQYTLYILDVESGEILDEPIPNAYYGAEWSSDGSTLFYTTLDETLRPHKLSRHRLGEPVAKDVVAFHEPDPAFFLSVSKTRSRRFIFVNLSSNTTTEEHFLEADDPDGSFRVVEPRRHEVEYYSAHHEDSFYILTNDAARNFRVMRAPVADPSRQNWREVLPHRDKVKVEDVDVFRNHLVVYERDNGLKRIRITDMRTHRHHYMEFREPAYTVWAAENHEYDANVLRFNYSSLVTPRSVIDYDMDARDQRLMKRYEVPGGYHPGHYACERVFATATDGTRIPISLVYRKGVARDGSAPLYLYGYGAYGATIEPHFSAARLSLLDRGFVFAIAHVRGGGALGREWYERGKLLNKRNTFTDFIACAEYLVERKYTSRGRIVCVGGSAGGLLVGAVLNLRPDLWGAAVASVPFVDVINTMMDESIPLTVTEYEEWGNPNDLKYYEYMRSYSPYDNVKGQAYPPLLVTAGFNDPRVQYWEPAKWVARLRYRKTDDNLLLLHVNLSEGHSGASGRYDHIRDVARDYAFVLDRLQITEQD
jgi:oligopeptidase B